MAGSFSDWLVNEGPIKIFMLFWLVANVIVFVVNWYKYQGDKYAHMRIIVGNGLPLARAAANILNLNAALILLPVCRNLVNYTRGCFEGTRSIRRLFDKNITFHKWCAYAICLGTVLHVVAHIFNVQRIVITAQPKYHRVEQNTSWEEILFTSRPGWTGVIITTSLLLMVTTAVEQIRRSYFELFWYTHHLFITFYAALLFHGSAGFVEQQTNTVQINQPCLPRDGSNTCRNPLATTDPDTGGNCPLQWTVVLDTTTHCCPDAAYRSTDPDGCCLCTGVPAYKAGMAGSWMWLVAPLVLYFLERMYRLIMSYKRRLKILKVVKHHDKIPVIEIQMERVPTLAGQYVFVNCDAISNLEWHPFTLTSCPEFDYISLHVRVCGDWTGALAEMCGMNCVTFRLRAKGAVPHKGDIKQLLKEVWPKRRVSVVHVLGDGRIQHPSDVDFSAADLDKLRSNRAVDEASVTDREGMAPHLLPRLAIDGPFGTCSEDAARFHAAVLVGAGIGVTPYASLLNQMYFRVSNPTAYPADKLKKVYFYWICPGFDAWGWFASLLMDLEEKLEAIGRQDFLEIRVYMTRGWSEDDAAKLMVQDQEDGDLVVRDAETGRALRHKMNFGRPMWDKDFADFSYNHAGENVGVFFCGPKVLSSTLHQTCNKFTNAQAANGVRFFYHKENF
eukprot:m.16775 g.16775  ORF g.16775 m.16775 type:complete len:672 (+) comp5330_c0_seq1:154-2169(+)